MTRKSISSKPCPSNLQPELRGASKKRAAVTPSPKAKRRKNGESAKEPSNNGSKADKHREASPSLPSKTSSPKPSGSLVLAGKAQVEIRLAFTPGEWADIQTVAAYDKTHPAQWERASVLSWVPETLDAIRRENLPPEARKTEDAKNARTIATIRQIMAQAELTLTPDEADAITLCASWERMTFAEFCRAGIFAMLESSFSNMIGFADNADGFPHGRQKERAWARKWHKLAAPIMARMGWNGMAFENFPQPLPDRPADPKGKCPPNRAMQLKGGRKG